MHASSCVNICLVQHLFPKAVLTSSMSLSHFFLSSLALLGLSGFALKTLWLCFMISSVKNKKHLCLQLCCPLHESALVYVVKHVIFIPFPCSAHTVCSVQHNSKNISQYLNSSLPDSYVIITLGLWFYRPADRLLPRDWLRVLKVRSVGPIGLNSVSNLVLWLACGE